MDYNVWFFGENEAGLGFRYLTVSFGRHKDFFYPILLSHVAKFERGTTVSLTHDSFSFNDKYWKSVFVLAVKTAYKSHLKYVYEPYADKLSKQLGDHSKALQTALCDDQYRNALRYVETEEFFERVHAEILLKSKKLPNGLRSVIMAPVWIRQGKPMWVTFGAHKSSSKKPTIQIGFKGRSSQINERRAISSFRDLFLYSSQYVARMIQCNKELEAEYKSEYALSVYFMLFGYWRELCVDYHFDVSDEIRRYSLTLGSWLERVNIEYGFLVGDHNSNILDICLTDADKPFIFSISEKPMPTATLEADLPRRLWIAITHSFGESGFTVNEIEQAINELGFSYSKSRVRSMVLRDCAHSGYSPNTVRPTRIYRAKANI